MEAHRYEVVGVVRAGRLGPVYHAHTAAADGLADVSVELALPETDEARVGLAFEAARRQDVVRHPGIPRLRKTARIGGRWAVVRDHVEGVELDALLGLRRLPTSVGVGLLGSLVDALAAAAEAPIGPVVHRDLRPRSLLLTAEGQVVVPDFGPPAEVAGAPRAPELVGDAPVDVRAEVWALGALAVEVLAPGVARGPQDRLDAAKDLPAPVRSLLGAMLGPPSARPDLREVQRTLARLVGEIEGPTLAGWSEERIPTVLALVQSRRARMGGDALVGQVLVEDAADDEPTASGGIDEPTVPMIRPLWSRPPAPPEPTPVTDTFSPSVWPEPSADVSELPADPTTEAVVRPGHPVAPPEATPVAPAPPVGAASLPGDAAPPSDAPRAVAPPTEVQAPPPSPSLSDAPAEGPDPSVEGAPPRRGPPWLPLAALGGAAAVGVALVALLAGTVPVFGAREGAPAALVAPAPPPPPDAPSPPPAPAPAAAPAPAPPPPPPPPAPVPPSPPPPPASAPPPAPRGQVTVDGDARTVSLRAGSRTARVPGSVPAGEWTLQVSFGDEAPRSLGTVVVPPSGAVAIVCSSVFESCKVER